MPMLYTQNHDKSNNKSWLEFTNELPLCGVEVEDIDFAKSTRIGPIGYELLDDQLTYPPHIGSSPLAH